MGFAECAYFCYMLKLLTLVTLLPLLAFSQLEPSWRSLSTVDGLPSNTIYCMLQSRDGRVFIAHERGLSVYNGLRIENYTNPLKTTPLSGLVEWEGNIWSRNFYNEVFVTEKESMKVTKVPELSFKQRGVCTFFTCGSQLFQRKDSRIEEILTDQGIRFKEVFVSRDNSEVHTAICWDGTIYSVTSNHIQRISVNDPDNVQSVEISGGAVPRYVALNGKMHLLRPDFASIRMNPFDKDAWDMHLEGYDSRTKVTDALQLKTGELLIGTFGGLYVYASNGKLLHHYFTDIQVSAIMQDIEGNVWVGSLQHGIRILPSMNIRTMDASESMGPREKISSIFEASDGSIFLGTYSGRVFRMNQFGKVELVHDFERDNEVQSIYYEPDTGHLWVFCHKLRLINLKRGGEPRDWQTGPGKTILPKGNAVYIGTSTGMDFLDDSGATHARDYRAWWIRKEVDQGEYMLLETSDGLKTMRYDQRQAMNLNLTINGERVPTENVSNLTGKDTDYCFSVGNKIYKSVSGKLSVFQAPCDGIIGLAMGNNSVYVTDGKEVWKCAHNGTVQAINESKGLTIENILWLRVVNDQLLVCGQDRLQLFGSELGRNDLKPSLLWDTGNGSFQLEGHYWTSDFFSNRLTMNFQLLPNVSANGRGKVLYRIPGVVDQWKEMERSEGRFRLVEERLPFGKYRLEVYGQNEDGLKTTIQTFDLHIRTPYYFSWWFLLLIASGLGLFIWWMVKWRIRTIQRKNHEKLEKERLKARALISEMRAIRSQMNPHFLFNCLSSIQTKILNDDSRSAYDSLSIFTKLMREALMYTSREFILLSEEIDFIRKYVHLEQMRRQDAFTFEMKIDPALDPGEYLFPSLLSQPFVENAILHGLMHQKGEKRLIYAVERTQNGICISIEDSGIGRNKSGELNRVNRKNHESFSTKAIEERVQLINENESARIEVQIEDLEVGTRVRIYCNSIFHENKHKGNHRR